MSQENTANSDSIFNFVSEAFANTTSFTGDVFESIAKGQTELSQAFDQVANAMQQDIQRLSNLSFQYAEKAMLAGNTASAAAYQNLAEGYRGLADSRLTATADNWVKSIASSADASASAAIGKLGIAGDAVQLGIGLNALATSGNATELGEAIAGIVGGGLSAALVAAGLVALGAPAVIGAIGVGILAGLAGVFGGDLAGSLFGGAIGDAISDFFTAASNWRPPVDPLTLDLDGDGLETLGLDTANPLLFDHDGDGVKTASGWVAPDDGFLVLDRNGNGTIDTGAELFGDSTPLAAGGTAADGFAALAQEDTNLDGKVDTLDANFANLRIWRDANQDGISQASELSTLAANNIAALNVAKTENSTLLANGNVIADLGTYVKTDGTTGTLGDTAQLGDIDLAENTFVSQFTDSVPITAEAEALPDMQGSGQVRDLREAASLSTALATALGNYAAAATRDTQQAQLDSLIEAWSDTSTMATTATGAYAGHDLTLSFAGITNDSVEYLAWLDKLTVLERFNGRTFQTVPDGTGPVTLNFSTGQMDLLDQSYEALRDSVYGALVMQTRFKPLIETIDLVLTGAANEGVFEFEKAA